MGNFAKYCTNKLRGWGITRFPGTRCLLAFAGGFSDWLYVYLLYFVSHGIICSIFSGGDAEKSLVSILLLFIFHYLIFFLELVLVCFVGFEKTLDNVVGSGSHPRFSGFHTIPFPYR